MAVINRSIVRILAVLAAAVLAVFLLVRRDSDKPIGTKPTIRVAYPAAANVDEIPSLLAHNLLREQGYTVEATFFTKPELAVEALVEGKAEFGISASRAFWIALSKGAPIISVMKHINANYRLVTSSDIKTCSDLHGRRLAVHGEAGITKALATAYLHLSCPTVQPQVLTIASGQNRAMALLAGEIDAAVVRLAEVIELDRMGPGKFHTLVAFDQEFPQLTTMPVIVNKNFAAQHPEAVSDYIRAILAVYRSIPENPTPVIEETKRNLDIDSLLLPMIIDRYTAAGTWDLNGTIRPEDTQYTIDFFNKVDGLTRGLTVDKVVDPSYLNAVLDEIGRR